MLNQKEKNMFKTYKKTQDPTIRENFIIQYLPLVKYVANKVANRILLPQDIDFDDLVGYGVFGLLDAIEKFDPSRDIKFKCYAFIRIRGAIYDELRSIDWVPRSIRQKAKEIESAVNTLENRLCRAPTDEEIAGELGIPVDDFQQTLLKICRTSLISVNDAWYLGYDSGKVSIIETIESPNSFNPDIMVGKEEVKKVIAKIIEELPEKEKKVLILYYYEDLKLKKIKEILNISQSRVSQIHAKAIIRLRSKLSHIKAI